jgi:hypothetical protein
MNDFVVQSGVVIPIVATQRSQRRLEPAPRRGLQHMERDPVETRLLVSRGLGAAHAAPRPVAKAPRMSTLDDAAAAKPSPDARSPRPGRMSFPAQRHRPRKSG